jgi:hypothetical protein
MVMSDETEKEFTQPVTIRMNPDVWARFRRTIPKGYTQQQCVDAAMRQWIDLPKEYRGMILLGEVKEPLVDVVRRIVDEQIARGQQVAAKLTAPPRKKRGRKD